MAYGEDTKGNEVYTVYVVDIDTGKHIGEPLKGVNDNVGWIDNETLIYVTQDDIYRPFKVCFLFALDLGHDRGLLPASLFSFLFS